MSDEGRPPQQRGDTEWRIEDLENRTPRDVVVWGAIGSTVASAICALTPPLNDEISFYIYLIGALAGLVTGTPLVVYQSSRRIGACCALISLGLLAFFPFIMMSKGG